MRKPTLEEVRKVLTHKGYPVFESGNYDLNLVGIRSKDMAVNQWNDWFCVFYLSNEGWQFHCYQATTDPGLYWLQNPMNARGCAILREDHYKGMWYLDPQNARRHYLRQFNNVTVYRDNDKDNLMEVDPNNLHTGKFGINCHSTGRSWNPEVIHKWSAGCQVLRNISEYEQVVKLAKKQRDSRLGNTFSYTLINECDFEDVGVTL